MLERRGLTTDVLRSKVPRLTAVEIHDDLAAALAPRLAGTNVEVVHGDATDTGLGSDRFSSEEAVAAVATVFGCMTLRLDGPAP